MHFDARFAGLLLALPDAALVSVCCLLLATLPPTSSLCVRAAVAPQPAVSLAGVWWWVRMESCGACRWVLGGWVSLCGCGCVFLGAGVLMGVVQSVCRAAARCEVSKANAVGWFAVLWVRWGGVGRVGTARVKQLLHPGAPQQQEAHQVLQATDVSSLLLSFFCVCLRPSVCLSVCPPACTLSVCLCPVCLYFVCLRHARLCPVCLPVPCLQAGRRHKRYKKSRRRLAALKGLVPLHGADAAKLRKLGFKKKWWFSLKA